MNARVRHPLFARLYSRAAEHEGAEQVEHRRQLVDGLSGEVIEVGAGSGRNFGHYPPSVAAVAAVEPEPYLRREALRAAGSAPVPITVVDGVAEALGFDDGRFDAAVVSLVLCTVPDQGQALAELQRVVRPGGELRFYEHVRSRRRRLRMLLELGDRSTVWPRLTGGCHPNRDSLAAIEQSGFVVERVREFEFAPRRSEPELTYILGAAIRR
jgi:ubiquinone/menaquinone biosynthesis C-methylase UbiE